LPQLHVLPLFIGQFLPVFLQLALSAAKAVVHITAIKIDNKIFTEGFIPLVLSRIPLQTSKMFQQ